MGLWGMFLNKKDADAISSDLHHQSMQTIHESNLRLERMRAKSRRHTELMLAIEIRDLNDRIAWLEEGIAMRDVQIEAYKGMRDKLLDMDDPKVAQTYLYQHFRIEDQALDKRLKSGELKRDPRKMKDWRENRGYIPPKQTIGKREPDTATPPPLPPLQDLD